MTDFWPALLDGLSAIALLGGGFFVFVGGLGAIRMPDLFTRMHATSVTDTLGSMLIISGLMLQAGLSLATLKLAIILLFLLLTSPVSGYALANSALVSGHRPFGIADDEAWDK